MSSGAAVTSWAKASLWSMKVQPLARGLHCMEQTEQDAGDLWHQQEFCCTVWLDTAMLLFLWELADFVTCFSRQGMDFPTRLLHF